MKLIHLEIVNFRCHKRVEIAFDSGITAIFGRNGTGKSSIIAAIQLALTGSTGDGPKTQDICVASDKYESSFVALVFEHGGTTYKVTRSLRGIDTKLEAPDMKSEIGERAVQETLDRLLEMDSAALAENIFVRQGRITQFVDSTTAERLSAFTRLFGLERAEVVYQACGDVLSDTSVIDVSSERDHINREYLETKKQLANCLNGLKDLPDLSTYDLESDPDRRIIRDAEILEESLRRRDQLQDEIDRNDKQGTDLLDRLESVESSLNKLSSRLHRLDRQSAEHDLECWKSYNSSKIAQERLRLERSHLDSVIAEPAPPIPDNVLPVTEELIDEWKQLRFQIQQAQNLKNQDSSNPICPTCKRYWPDRENSVKKANETIERLSKRFNQLELSIDYEEKYRQWSNKQNDAKRRLESLPNPQDLVSKPKREIVVCEQIICEAKKIEADISRLDNERNELNNSIQRLAGSMETRYQELERLNEVITLKRLSAVGADEAKLRLDKKQREWEQFIKLTAEVNRNRSQLIKYKERRIQLRNREREAKNLNKRLDQIRQVRDALHRDNVPRILIQNRLRYGLEEANGLLESFGTPFRIDTKSGINLDVLLPSGQRLSSRRLSGGQKVILSLAIRVALQVHGLGVILFDEPTQFLDQASRHCLRQALERLRQLSSSLGLQGLIVTHDDDLGPLFDSVIRLSSNREG